MEEKSVFFGVARNSGRDNGECIIVLRFARRDTRNANKDLCPPVVPRPT